MSFKACSKCKKDKDTSEFSARPDRPSGLQSACKKCRSRIANTWNKRNKDRRKEYVKDNKDKINESAKKRYQADPDKHIKAVMKSRRKHPDKHSYHSNLYKVTKISRAPKWLSQSDLNEIKKTYKKASDLTKQTGILHHVDHEIPLRGKEVSGLHVPWNLRVITASENCKKGNKVLI